MATSLSDPPHPDLFPPEMCDRPAGQNEDQWNETEKVFGTKLPLEDRPRGIAGIDPAGRRRMVGVSAEDLLRLVVAGTEKTEELDPV